MLIVKKLCNENLQGNILPKTFLTRMMSMNDLVPITLETPRIDSGYSLEKEFTELIHMNP